MRGLMQPGRASWAASPGCIVAASPQNEKGGIFGPLPSCFCKDSSRAVNVGGGKWNRVHPGSFGPGIGRVPGSKPWNIVCLDEIIPMYR